MKGHIGSAPEWLRGPWLVNCLRVGFPQHDVRA